MSFFDDEAAEATSDVESMPISRYGDASSQPQEVRAVKRRRLNGHPHRPSGSSTDGDDNYDLPPNNLDLEDDPQEQRVSKHLTHVPEYGGPHESVFVTQADQPHSSPSRIRGPRWRKKSPNPSPQELPSKNLQQSAREYVKDANAEFDDFDDGDADLLEAFLSSPVNQVQKSTAPDLSLSSEAGASYRPPQPTQGPLRQTTLFGHVSPRKETQSSQSRTHNWPLANRDEKPTHHKLDYEALTTWTYPTNLGKTRDYQFNIVQRALYHNLLVALPTGLGKTFIAATVMLNWFKWTKDAQIIFVAPTKPLVAQQVDACFSTVGIPRSQTTMLVGSVPPVVRAEEWQSKRVFFMTPQTLINDLKSGACDPKRIVLLVVDEAHRAKGSYAYVEVVKFLRRWTSSFRVLALTATPGSTIEAVQDVIDGLDISRVEIRTEQSLDIREFVHSKDIEPVQFENSDEMTMCLELFSSAVRPIMNQLTSQNAYWSKDPTSITLYGLKKAQDDWMKSAGRNANQGQKGMIRAIFAVLTKLALPIDLLKYHGIGPFYHKLKAFEDESRAGQSKYAKQIATNEHFKKLMNRMKSWIENDDFEGHPKMSYLKTAILNHFMDAGEGQDAGNEGSHSNTRIMVFASWRDSVEQISRVLKRHQPMIRPHVFVGQAASSASEGMDQKFQQDIIDKFKKGVFNVLVATSIGEEGLDIGEIDLIICYDCSKSPIRMLQRIGRTGRKRTGIVKALMMKGKEENDFEKANDNYVKIQALIASGKNFHYHDDRSPRIMPKEIKPLVNKCVVEIPVENTQAELPEPRKRAARNAKRPAKRFNMPDGVETGFTFLGDGKKARKRVSKSDVTNQLSDCEIADLPLMENVLLTSEQESSHERHYAQVNGSEAIQIIHFPRVDAFPEKMIKLGRTTIPHSAATRRLVKAHQLMRDPDRDWTRPTDSDILDFVDSSVIERLGQPSSTERSQTRRQKLFPEHESLESVSSPSNSQESILEDNDLAGALSETELSDDSLEPSIAPTAKSIDADQPFYISQNSMNDDEELDEVLPDFAVMGRIQKQNMAKPDRNGTKETKGRKRATRMVSDDDE